VCFLHFKLAFRKSGQKFLLMDTFYTNNSETFNKFFAPVYEEIANCKNTRHCPDLSDSQWIEMGVSRTLMEAKSGRGFLQQYNIMFKNQIETGHFFETLKSERRLKFCQQLNKLLCSKVKKELKDCLSEFEELKGFDVYAGDGHWHAAACHDSIKDEKKWPVGHFYIMDLRNYAIQHLEMADEVERKHEHDMRALKRQSIDVLRQGAPTGRKVLYVWDSACLGFDQWDQWKRMGGVYFVTRAKENHIFAVMETMDIDLSNPVNEGVLEDEIVMPKGKIRFRRIKCEDPVTGKTHTFITNQLTLSPGLLCQLYRTRWDLEKVFDQFKNNFNEKQAWANTKTAKTMQANFLCMTHNLILVINKNLEVDFEVYNVAEIKRKKIRLTELVNTASAAGRKVSSYYYSVQRLTKISLKFIRCLRGFLFIKAPISNLTHYLRRLYAVL
jgi:hypothetical protein